MYKKYCRRRFDFAHLHKNINKQTKLKIMINIKGYKINKLGNWYTTIYLITILLNIIIIIIINDSFLKMLSSFLIIFLSWILMEFELNDLLLLKYKIQTIKFKNRTNSFNLYKLQLGILFIPYWKFIGTRSDLLEAEKLMKEDITKTIKSRIKFFYKEKYIKETRYY